MDPLALAQLPLATLALAAIFWVVIQLFRFASERLDAERARTARHNRLLYHAGHNRGVVLATLSSTVTTLDHIARMAREHVEPDPPAPPEGKDAADAAPEGFAAFTNWLERGFAAKKAAEASAPPPELPLPRGLATRIAQFGDFATTPDRLDMEDVARNLDTFDPEIAGLVLSFIEEVPMVYALIEQANGQNDKPETVLDYVGTLISLQFSCLSAAMSSRAIVDTAFRKKLHEALDTTGADGKPDTVLAARQLYGLARRELAWVDRLWYWGPAGGPLLVHLSEGGEAETGGEVPAHPIDTSSAPLFRGEGLKVMNVSRRQVSVEDYYALPVLVILLLALGLLVAPVRNYLFPPDPPDQLSCTTTVAASGATETECTHTAPDLATGLAAGQAAGADLGQGDADVGQETGSQGRAEPQDQPAEAEDASTATGRDGAVAPLVAPDRE